MIKGDTIADTIKLFEKTNYTFATYSKSKWWYLDDKCNFFLEPCSGKAWNIVEQHESNLDFVWSVTAAGPGCRIYQTRLIRSLGATRKSTEYSPNQTDSNKCSRWNMFPITLNNYQYHYLKPFPAFELVLKSSKKGRKASHNSSDGGQTTLRFDAPAVSCTAGLPVNSLSCIAPSNVMKMHHW